MENFGSRMLHIPSLKYRNHPLKKQLVPQQFGKIPETNQKSKGNGKFWRLVCLVKRELHFRLSGFI